jgi:hypothetical protein
MAQWQKIKITRENGEEVDAQAPIIISASRLKIEQKPLNNWSKPLAKAG